ncbi:uncharacterized protein N0V89_005919 [Didymosphaeria variabile]|uniref:BEN domain-containing protein n=1 Tax=Didymosphaeria variabile TaxID=1932322 RepID=A0A9W9CAY1_9PLEO|nr:uncharacterized protein N0V89_005919 [Didymosphaeria variabile]KAJ4354186.1 hypothetical protein N0V89_005919 [Didymosphaeria variabile]
MDSEHTPADLEAATALLLLSKRPIHWIRQYQQAPPASVESLRSSIDGGPPRKRVRLTLHKFQEDMSPNDEPMPTPPLTRASSIESAGSQSYHADDRVASIKVELQKRTFEKDYIYAREIAKHCQQPLYRSYNSDTAAESALLTLKKHAAGTTELGRHASHFVGHVPNTTVANKNTDTTSTTTGKNTQRKMDGFWQAPDGSMPFQQHSTGPIETTYLQGGFLDQADINKALFAAIDKMHSDVIRTSTSNQMLYEHVGMLRGHIQMLEQDNTQLRTVVEGLRGVKQQRQPPKLSLGISKLDLNDFPTNSLPTPSTGTLSSTNLAFPSRPTSGTGVAFPKTAISSSTGPSFAEATSSSFEAPAVVPPTPTTPGSRTVLYKKDKHDLTGKLPPANVKLPLVPLTDVELIVFFYNSTLRPIVSVRLYARGGPNVIAQVINDHRVVNPDGYKRNTCSVHCNKAVKTFIRENGEETKKKISDFFEVAGDVEATDAIRHDESELSKTCDFPVLDLFKDLTKFPSDGQAGIFTDCIRWCQNNQVGAKVSQVHLIGESLMNGTDPLDNLDLSSAGTSTTRLLDDSSDLTSMSDEENHPLPSKSAKSTKKPIIKTENSIKD